MNSSWFRGLRILVADNVRRFLEAVAMCWSECKRSSTDMGHVLIARFGVASQDPVVTLLIAASSAACHVPCSSAEADYMVCACLDGRQRTLGRNARLSLESA